LLKKRRKRRFKRQPILISWWQQSQKIQNIPQKHLKAKNKQPRIKSKKRRFKRID
jgi:hypothetical protein